MHGKGNGDTGTAVKGHQARHLHAPELHALGVGNNTEANVHTIACSMMRLYHDSVCICA